MSRLQPHTGVITYKYMHSESINIRYEIIFYMHQEILYMFTVESVLVHRANTMM